MVWWRINPSEDDKSWDEAIPGKHHEENHYNGDGPTDAMHEMVSQISKYLRQLNITPTIALLAQIVKYSQPPAKIVEADRKLIIKIVRTGWRQIRNQYKQSWNRPPYSEEIEAIANFVLNGWIE